MPFISYAQNFEDLMLWRALRSVKQGFYVDVGANDPRDESVTKVFYDSGWSGINVEPDKVPFDRLVAERPRDTNLNIGVWSKPETRTFYVVDGCSALSTAGEWMSDQHRQAGLKVRPVTMSMLDLKTICRLHVGVRDIHFLKVDVEGSEPEIFMGHDFTKWRPWIILFEAHGPDPLSTHHEPGERLILGAGYRFVYDDGLNRFYIAEEHYENLKIAFVVPPNSYDDWYRFRDLRFSPPEILAEIGVAAWSKEVPNSATNDTQSVARSPGLELESELTESRNRLAEQSARIRILEAGLDALRASTSWRITAPLRRVRMLFS